MTLTKIQITPELKGVIAVPEGVGPWPSVVMVHEVFGIDDAMRAQITRLSSAGYVVLMPDLSSRTIRHGTDANSIVCSSTRPKEKEFLTT
jgi:carboxymethylenebutenolidase